MVGRPPGLLASDQAGVEHPVPPNLNWWYVLGSATLVAFIVQVVTGVALAFSYVPAPNSAYESLQFITNRRYWAASCAACTTGAPRRWCVLISPTWRTSS